MSKQGVSKRWGDAYVPDWHLKHPRFKKHRKVAKIIAGAFIIPVSDFGIKDCYKSPWTTFCIIDNLADYFVVGDRRLPRKARKKKACKTRRQDDRRACMDY